MTAPEKRRGAAVERASLYLAEQAQQSVASGRTRLPTISQMARSGGFSPATLSKAVARLRREGVLSAVQRGGIRVLLPGGLAAAEPRDGRPVPSPRGWKGLAQRVASDIVAGVYLAGAPLPLLKELEARYGASYATLRRALESLALRRVLEPYKRGFRVHDPQPHSSHASLVLVAHSESIGDLGTVIPRNPEFLRLLERECLRRRLTLVIRTDEDELRGRVAASGGVLGYLLWVRGIPQERLGRLVERLAAAGRPAAVLDESGLAPQPRLTGQAPLMRVFSVAYSSLEGEALGNYLLGLGHRRVAYLSPVGRTLYCRRRYEGLAQAFAAAGLGGAVTRLASMRFASFEELVARGRGTAALRDLDRQVRRSEARTDPDVAGPEVDYFYRLYTETYVLRRAIQAELRPLLEQALAQTQATAWVGVNDWTALVAMDWLRRRQVAVPQQVALAGFDDTFEAFSHGLTSYDFNTPALVQAMLAHVLEPPTGRKQLPPLEIPGVVVARHSTARRL